MSSAAKTDTNPTNADATPSGRVALGIPFAQQTAALRAALLASVTERDIQDIVEILLVKAKYGHFPSIKLLFTYALGKPQAPVNPEALDPQEWPSQPAPLSPAALAALLTQPLVDLQAAQPDETVQVTPDDSAAEDRAAEFQAPEPVSLPHGDSAAPTAAPSPNRENGPAGGTAAASAPATMQANDRPLTAPGEKRPSANGEKRHRPKHAGFDWLRDLRNSVT
jgi:hypothetical protein